MVFEQKRSADIFMLLVVLVLVTGKTNTALADDGPICANTHKSDEKTMATTPKVDASVQSFFVTNPNGSVEVLLVLAQTAPAISMSVNPVSGALTPEISSGPTDPNDAKQIVENQLRSIGITPENWLAGAGSFVVEISSKDLPRLLEFENIEEIVPNETLKSAPGR